MTTALIILGIVAYLVIAGAAIHQRIEYGDQAPRRLIALAYLAVLPIGIGMSLSDEYEYRRERRGR